ncbi:MAG: efflux RND transporter periplasmic adaptor subunit [Candidatus Eisenbacteria bacterium]
MSSPDTDLSSLRIDRDAGATGATRTRRLRWILPVAVLVLVAAGAWWLVPRAVEVKVGAVETSGGVDASGGISANGYVVARTKASVSAKIPGRLAYLGVAEGSRVRRGEIIARLESGDVAAAVEAARANVGTVEAQLAQARRDLARAEQLKKSDVVSDLEVENARTQVDVLTAQLASAHAQVDLSVANLENTNVRAPFDGTVLRKDAEVGEIVAPSSAGGGLTRTAIVTMADLGTLEVEVDVNEAYIAQVRNGESTRITLDAYPDTSFDGRVRQVVPTADRQKATVLVKVAILDKDPRILPEMGARVVFMPQQGTGVAVTVPRRVLVPRAAIVSDGAAKRVWTVEHGTVKSQAVELGAERGDRVEVRSGLTGGESVVLDPPATLRDGTKVRIPEH